MKTPNNTKQFQKQLGEIEPKNQAPNQVPKEVRQPLHIHHCVVLAQKNRSQ
jgi:hypothetical protein